MRAENVSRGFTVAYVRACSVEEVEAVLVRLEANGLSLANQVTRRVTRLGSDGRQMEVQREGLAGMLYSQRVGSEISFQLWLDAGVDVVCRTARTTDGLLKFRYSFDGLEAAESEQVIQAVTLLIAEPSVAVRALVLDRRGAGEEADWDTLVSTWAADGDEPPCDVLLIRPRFRDS